MVNYAVTSSGAGRQQYAAGGQYDFAASDIVYNLEDGTPYQQIQAGTFAYPFKYVTVSAGGLAFQYNLVIGGQQFDNLNLTPADACGIFTGEITNWSQLASGPYATTGDQILASFSQPIIPVVRSDSAGESYVLSQYCQAVEPQEWSTFKTWVDNNASGISYSDPNMSAGLPVSLWPGTLYNGDTTVQSDSGATAASESVKNPGNNGAITYVADAYAKVENSPVASVENAAGYFVQPTPNNVQLALSYAVPNSLGTFSLNFTGNNPNAYFPSTYSYVIDPTTTKTPDSGVNGPLNQYLCYSIGAGQQEAGTLLYAPLSKQVTALSVAAIESTLNAPPASQCGIGGPAPSVAANGGGISGNSGGNGTTTGHSTAPVKSTNPPPPGTGTTGGGGGQPGSTQGGSPSSGGGTGSTQGSTGTGGTGTGTGTGASGTGGATGTSCTSTSGTTKSKRHGKRTATCTPSSGSATGGSTGSSGASGGSGSTGGQPATQTVETAAASSSAPLGNQALWWVLGGLLLAAGVSWVVGMTRRPSA